MTGGNALAAIATFDKFVEGWAPMARQTEREGIFAAFALAVAWLKVGVLPGNAPSCLRLEFVLHYGEVIYLHHFQRGNAMKSLLLVSLLLASGSFVFGQEENPVPSNDGSRQQRMLGVLQSLDTNHDGNLDAEELQAAGSRGEMVKDMIRKTGLAEKYPLKISDLQEAIQKARNNGVANIDANAETVATITEIQKAWKDRQDRTKSARFEWKQKRFIAAGTQPGPRIIKGNRIDGEWYPKSDVTFENTRAFSFNGKMFRYTRSGPDWHPANGKVLEQYPALSSFDGEVGKQYFGYKDEADPSNPIAGFFQKESHDSNAKVINLIPILLNFRGCDEDMGGRSLSEFVVSPETGKIDDQSCVVISYNDETFWLAPQQEFIVKRVVFSRSGTTLDISYKQDDKHGWVPSGWKFTKTLTKANKILEQTEATVTHYEINIAIPQTEFKFDFPPGTYVTDLGLNEQGKHYRYILDKNHGKRMITEEEIRRGATYQELLTTESGKAGLNLPGKGKDKADSKEKN